MRFNQLHRLPITRIGNLAIWIALLLLGSVTAQDDDDNLGVTIQLPTLGVSIDAQGVLATSVFRDDDGSLWRARVAAAKQNVPQQMHAESPLRKISLRRLESEIKKAIETPGPIPDDISCLAGLTKIEYVFVRPEDKDVIIAGPAEPWVENLAGRKVGFFSNKPTMLLQDWVAALRTFEPGKNINSWVACSIDPSKRGLENLREVQRNLPRQVATSEQEPAAKEFAKRLREGLGLANVKVYGIDARTNAAHVMIEADYRMKMIAVGLEQPPIRMKTFVGELKGAPKHLQRWWLTPNYKCLRQTDDQLAVQMVGSGVRLQTENIVFGKQANIRQTQMKPSRAARTYANSFTKNYEQLASVRPVFAQLRNVVDSLILAAWIRKTGAFATAGWKPQLLLDETQYSVAQKETIKHAQCVANAVWKNNVLILPAGGGVSIQASKALQAIAPDSDHKLSKIAGENPNPDNSGWWWD